MDRACLVPALPFEILWEIASWMMMIQGPLLAVAGPDSESYSGPSVINHDTFYKPEWAVMDGFSTASKALRMIALKNWFRSVHIRGDSDWAVISSQFSFIYKWTRVVQWQCGVSSSQELGNAYEGLARFGNLVAVRLHTQPFKLRPLHSEDIEIDDILRVLPRTICELDVFDSVYPDPRFIIIIAQILPELHTLRLKQPSIWCSVCNLCNIPCFDQKPPKKLVYTSAEGLPKLYAQWLSTLHKLHTVQLTIAALTKQGSVGNFDSNNPLGWSGECRQCTEILGASEDFQAEWVEGKKGFHPVPPNLKLVEWRFLELSEFGDEWTDKIYDLDMYNVNEGD